MSTTCGLCNRPLRDPDSVARGYGPVCAAGVLGHDTHVTPIPRRHRRKRLPEDQVLTDFPPLQKVQKGHTR